MDPIVECPGCKTALRIDRAQELAHVICPSCQRTFDASQARRREADADAPIPMGESIDRPAAAPIPFGTLVPTHGSSSDDDVNPNAVIRVETKRKVRHRKKKSPWPPVLGLLGLTAFVALFGGYAYYARQKQSEMAALQKEKEMRAQPTPRAQPAPRVRTPSRRPIADASESADEIRIPEPDDFSLETAKPELDPAPVDPIRRLLETLDQSGEPCEAFQFLPENESQYEQLQTFALQLSLAKSFLADDQERDIDSKDRSSLTERSVHWLQTMKALVKQVATDAPERLPRINAFAKREFEEGDSLDKAHSQVIVYGFVFLRGEHNLDSVVKLDRKQVYFSVPTVPEFERTSDESYRIFFVETPDTPSQKRMHSPGGGLIKVSSAKLIYAFDPIGSED